MKKRLFAIFFLVLMAVLGGASVAGCLIAHILDSLEKEMADVPVVRTFAGDYPFTDNEDSPRPEPESKICPCRNG